MSCDNFQHTLSLENVNFYYDGYPALKDVNLTFGSGSMTALIGPNGSGKTTLLKVASGLLENYCGSVKIGSSEISGLMTSERARLVSFTPSGIDFPFEFSVREAVSQGRSPHIDMFGNLSALDEGIIDETIRKMALKNFEKRSVNRLSQGEKERVIIARHLAQNAPVMLFDESLAHLDLKHRLALLEELKKMSSQGRCIVVALHEIELAARFFQSIVIMRDGLIVKSGTMAETINSETLSKAYDLDFRIINTESPDTITIVPMNRVTGN